jgi:hypothetical protein
MHTLVLVIHEVYELLVLGLLEEGIQLVEFLLSVVFEHL